VITWVLIATNCIAFLFESSLSPYELQQLLYQFALVPGRYSGILASDEIDPVVDDVLPLFTMMFLHGGWLHLILNMWTLWLFGPTIEDRLGQRCGFCRAYLLQPGLDRTGIGRLGSDGLRQASRLSPSWSSPNGATGLTLGTKACSASILKGGSEVPFVGGFHVDR
jgi:hypothetical protein